VALWLEIVISIGDAGPGLLRTGDSLLQQSERDFGVILSVNGPSADGEITNRFCRELELGGIPVKRLQPPFESGWVANWNWAAGQVNAEWLLLLASGDVCWPNLVKRFRQRIEARPPAVVIACATGFRARKNLSQTGGALERETLTPQEFLALCPEWGWLGGRVSVACRRAAWQAAGGYAVHFPVCAGLRLNVMLALRYGLDLIGDPVDGFEPDGERFRQGVRRSRTSLWIELWLILRQARNYCRDAKLPWPEHHAEWELVLQLRKNYLRTFEGI
jgi:hypothetical protein